MAAKIVIDQCTGCGNCLAACPRNLLKLTDGEQINGRGVRYAELSSPDACVDCGTCELMCTAGAIRVDRSPAVSGYDLIRKDKVPPHAGCYLGTLSKVLADEIVRRGIRQDTVIFEKKAPIFIWKWRRMTMTAASFTRTGCAIKGSIRRKS